MVQENVPNKGLAAFILSPEFRWPYFVIVGFMLILGFALCVLGAVNLVISKQLTSGIVNLASGILALILAMAVRQIRRYFHRLNELAEQSEKIAQTSVELSKRKEDAVARIQQLQKERAEKEFKKNLASTILLERFKVNEMVLFPRAVWNFQPGMNILLGRNGYGKSLLLRSLAAALQNEEEPFRNLLLDKNKSEEPSVEINLRRNNEATRIRKNSLRFVESIGKVPLLAIPDSRFRASQVSRR
jgi:ABC-type transport system involved in cytochrome bd biosynthesis fused ATPase/permease subunit